MLYECVCYLRRNLLPQQLHLLFVGNELDLVLSGLLNEGADYPPQAPKDERGIQKPELS